MTTPTLNRPALTDPSWWHWALTIPLVVLHLLGYPWAMPAVMAFSAVAAVYFWTKIKQLRPYPVQVRLAYVVWSAIGMLPYMQWMHWIQLFGTTAMVTVGYCPLIRMLSLLSWNRTQPFSQATLWHAFFKEPVAGGFFQWPTAAPTAVCCSLPTAKNKPQELQHAQAN